MSANSRCGVAAPSRKTAVPRPVPSVITSSSPSPRITASPCMSASFKRRVGFPSRPSSSAPSGKPAHASANLRDRAVPGPALVERLGAVSTRPARTNPGNPTATRSQDGSWWVSLSSSRTRTRGQHGYGVLVRTRLTIFAPSASRTDALRPVPPMSIASVVGRFTPDPPCASFTFLSCHPGRVRTSTKFPFRTALAPIL